MGLLKIIMHPDADSTYLLNCFRYVINGHTIQGCYGGVNICPENAYRQMLAVKQYFGKTTGNQLVHFVISLNTDVYYEEMALRLAYRIAEFYSDRYQIIFGIHDSQRKGKYGKMYADNKSGTHRFLQHIQKVTNDYQWKIVYAHQKDED